MCESVSAAVITDLDAKQGMRYINITQFLLSVGAISGPIVLQFCMKNLNTDWRFGFGICAAGFLIITVLLKGTEFPEKRENKAKEEDGCNLMSRVQKETIACFLISIILYVGLENGFGYFVNPLFTVQLKQAGLGAIAISGYWMGMSASRLLCGFRNYNAERMLLVCFWVSGILFYCWHLQGCHGCLSDSVSCWEQRLARSGVRWWLWRLRCIRKRRRAFWEL